MSSIIRTISSAVDPVGAKTGSVNVRQQWPGSRQPIQEGPATSPCFSASSSVILRQSLQQIDYPGTLVSGDLRSDGLAVPADGVSKQRLDMLAHSCRLILGEKDPARDFDKRPFDVFLGRVESDHGGVLHVRAASSRAGSATDRSTRRRSVAHRSPRPPTA